MMGCDEAWLRSRVILAIIIKQCITGGWHIVQNEATKDINPLVFQWSRDIGATICCWVALILYCWYQGATMPWRNPPKKRDLAPFIIYGCCNTYFCEYYDILASEYSYPMLTSMWLNVEPIMVVIISLLSGVEVLRLTGTIDEKKSPMWNLMHTPGLWKMIGLAITVTGSIVYVVLDLHWNNHGGKDGKHYPHLASAHAYMFFEIAGAGVYHTLEKKLLKDGYSALECQTWGYTCGVVLISLIAIPQVTEDQLSKLKRAENWYFISYGTVGLSFIGATLITWANKKSGPIFVASFRPLQTIMTAVWQVLFRKVWNVCSVCAVPTAATGVAALIIVPGVYCLTWSRYLETRGAAGHGDDDTAAGGARRMRLRAAQRQLLEVEEEVTALRAAVAAGGDDGAARADEEAGLLDDVQ